MDKHDLRMRSESLDLKNYDTDKGQSGYLRHYDRMFASLVDRPINLLEIGVRKGGSLLSTPSVALYIPPMIWDTQYKYSPDAVLLVFAKYDPNDYIRDYANFLKLSQGGTP